MSQSVIGALRANLGLDAAQFERGVGQAQASMQRLGRNLQRLGAAVSAFGAAFTLAIRSQMVSIDELAKDSRRIGIPVEALSQLHHAADLSAVAATSLRTAMQRLAVNAESGADVFHDLGIELRDANGQIRPMVDLLDNVADALTDLPEGAERTAAAVAVFGRSGADMLPMLAGGSAGLREMTAEADRLGLTVGSDTAEAVERFNDNLTRLGGTFTGIIRTLTSELSPALAEISDLVTGWAMSLADAFQGLGPETQRFIGVLAGMTVVVGPLTIALGLMVAALATVSAPVLAVIGAITVLTAGVIAFLPQIRAMIATVTEFATDVVTGAVSAVRDLRVAFMETLGAAVQWVIDRFNDLLRIINNTVEAFRTVGRVAGEAFSALFGGGVDHAAAQRARFSGQGIGESMAAGVVQGVRDGLSENERAYLDALDLLNDGARNVFEIRSPSRVFMRIGGQIIEGLVNGIRGGIGAAVAAISDLRGALSVDMSGMAEHARDAFAEIGKTMEDSLTRGFMSIFDGTKSAAEAFRDMARQIISELFRVLVVQQLVGQFQTGGGGILGALAGGLGVPVGQNANGTSNWRGGLTLVGERGAELVNLPRGSQVMDAQRTSRMLDSGGDVIQNFHFNLSANGDESVRKIVAQAAPQIVEAAKSGVLDARRRGGSFRAAFG